MISFLEIQCSTVLASGGSLQSRGDGVGGLRRSLVPQELIAERGAGLVLARVSGIHAGVVGRILDAAHV